MQELPTSGSSVQTVSAEHLSIRAAARLGTSAHTLWYLRARGAADRRAPRGEPAPRVHRAGTGSGGVLAAAAGHRDAPIRQVRAYIDLVRAGAHTTAQRRELLAAHERQVLARVTQLQGDLQAIRRKLDHYDRQQDHAAVSAD